MSSLPWPASSGCVQRGVNDQGQLVIAQPVGRLQLSVRRDVMGRPGVAVPGISAAGLVLQVQLRNTFQA